jgi:ferredoxin
MSETVTRKMMFVFPKCECEKPIIYHLVKDYDLVVNVFRAKVTPEAEGYLVLDLTGSEERIAKAVEFVRTFNVSISTAGKGVTWSSDACTHCGACLTHCPTQALRLSDSSSRKIMFDDKQCIECLACIRVCPYRACVSVF